MIDNDLIKRVIPISIHDGSIIDVHWLGECLDFKIRLCNHPDGTPHIISLRFVGVDWIRSLCDEEHDGYAKETDYSEYPLIDREALNANYEEYVSYGLLDDITVAENGVIFVNDIFFFHAVSLRRMDVLQESDCNASEQNTFL